MLRSSFPLNRNEKSSRTGWQQITRIFFFRAFSVSLLSLIHRGCWVAIYCFSIWSYSHIFFIFSLIEFHFTCAAQCRLNCTLACSLFSSSTEGSLRWKRRIYSFCSVMRKFRWWRRKKSAEETNNCCRSLSWRRCDGESNMPPVSSANSSG